MTLGPNLTLAPTLILTFVVIQAKWREEQTRVRSLYATSLLENQRLRSRVAMLENDLRDRDAVHFDPNPNLSPNADPDPQPDPYPNPSSDPDIAPDPHLNPFPSLPIAAGASSETAKRCAGPGCDAVRV